MTSRRALVLSVTVSGCVIAFGLVAQQSAPEAPAALKALVTA
jgi:hypothetical protein